MPGEIQAAYTTGATLYAVIRDATGRAWTGTAFEVYQTAHLSSYAIAMTEQGTASGFYTGDFPAGAGSGCSAVVYERSGGSPAEGDTAVASGPIEPPLTVADAVAVATSANQFTGGTGLSAVDGFYLGSVLVFTSGSLLGIGRKVTGYTGVSRTFAFSAAFPGAPSAGDRFELLGRIDG